ncbi:hypothetical protein FAT51_21930 [Klebsiella pneumoniae]|nr:hypothetical protein FAT46_20570 [Klebsiella pneumoniae]THR71626.1 hypothetical protein FAT51_21930 [Klebsiella pneumoniae]THR85073.1 hypothetical protein FAT48_22185 [Klebsiella pneumoniae subsp. pneumoniae]
MGNTNWRTEPTNVEKLADDLWLGVKGQSNREIAGSPSLWPDKVRSTAFIASQNSVTNACGMVNRIVNLPDDTSRKIIISSYD